MHGFIRKMSSQSVMKQDVIIIGAGIIGLATAERLLTQGATVTILERNEAGQESSWAGGGILSPLCPWHYSDDVTRLTSYSARLFPAWINALQHATNIDAEYEVSGMQVLPPYNSQAAQHWCAAHGMQLHHHAEPGQALFLPDIAQVRSPRLLRALQHRVITLGGRIVEYCTVHNVMVTRRRVNALATSSGRWHADYYIVTAGAWSKEILGAQAFGLDIKPIRGQMLLFKFATPPVRTLLLQQNLYLIPRRDGHVLVGSTLEDVGFNKQTTRIAREDLLKRATILLPLLQDMPIIRHWAGLRPASPHNIPTIGKHPLLNNLYINCGHFRYGVTMAPASAEILLNEMTGTPQPFDTAPYQMGWQTR
ncbi:glycine oxidase [Nitrosomonas cryotolerans ATCC 49181]|uniref:Glycine oxidase n=3 Tax=Nitrosomonas cryotolerans TaxID=44575 RepID=A0A1N6FJ53_9PROT|nr:glycine oxidase [Nitrosomonas cryotolerans ATCC 49181]